MCDQESRSLLSTRCRLAIAVLVSTLGANFALANSPQFAGVLAPGVISGAGSNFAPAFSRDSSYVLFTRKADTFSILVSHRQGSTWSAPVAAPFSGRWNDLEAAISPDGSYVIFASDRPVPGSTKALRSTYGDKTLSGGNLWRVQIQGGVWTEPERLPATINDSESIWTPSIAANGNLYFMKPDRSTARFRLHVASSAGGAYQSPIELPFSTGAFNDVDPMIDSMERWVIFSSDRAAPGPASHPGPERLFIAFDPRGPAPIVCPLSIAGWEDRTFSQIEARLSPDEGTLYFASSRGRSQIWKVKLLPQLWQSSSDDQCRHAGI
jgi:hypothetical protein